MGRNSAESSEDRPVGVSRADGTGANGAESVAAARRQGQSGEGGENAEESEPRKRPIEFLVCREPHSATPPLGCVGKAGAVGAEPCRAGGRAEQPSPVLQPSRAEPSSRAPRCSRAEQSRAEQSRAEQSRAEQSRAEQPSAALQRSAAARAGSPSCRPPACSASQTEPERSPRPMLGHLTFPATLGKSAFQR
ncbi:brain acid soluble protein 1-like [Octodon degus]|uniref:Brain acid soluble protein 1-like n=1 Tax=Octodon degus TaxID=10160 RepID=A0A6P3V9H3_OCTDE|nr:brain acid soluble protein 1-like [Octodon degus]